MVRCIVIILLCAPSLAHAQAFISEVSWAGSELSTADEWLEIGSTGSDTDLSGGWIAIVEKTATGSTEEIMITFPAGTIVHSGSAFIVSNYAAAQSALNIDPQFVSTSVSLSNSVLRLKLYGPGGILLDDIGGGKPPAGYSSSDGSFRASMERISRTLPGTDPAAWASAEDSVNLDDGALLYATPGIINIIDEAAVPPATQSGSMPTTSAYSQVRITEFLPNPAGTDTAHEWVELFNPADTAADISLLTLMSNKRSLALINEPPMAPQEYRQIFVGKALQLPNAGGNVRLLQGSADLQNITYPKLPTGIGYAQSADDDWSPACIVTPGKPAVSPGIDALIAVQDGSLSAAGSTAVNFRTMTDAISPVCVWDYGDGTTSASCNPGRKSYKKPGYYLVKLMLSDYCGNTVIREKEVHVHARETAQETAAQTSSAMMMIDPAAKAASNMSNSPAFVPLAPDALIIEEIFAHPLKDAPDMMGREWIRFRNTSDEFVSLGQWIIDDGPASSKPQRLGSGASMAPNAAFTLMKPQLKVSLNDGGETLTLTDPHGAEYVSVAYPKLRAGESYVRSGAGWCIAVRSENGGEPVCISEKSIARAKASTSTTSRVRRKASSPARQSYSVYSLLTLAYRSKAPEEPPERVYPVSDLLASLQPVTDFSSGENNREKALILALNRGEIIFTGVILGLCMLIPLASHLYAKNRKFFSKQKTLTKLIKIVQFSRSSLDLDQ